MGMFALTGGHVDGRVRVLCEVKQLTTLQMGFSEWRASTSCRGEDVSGGTRVNEVFAG